MNNLICKRTYKHFISDYVFCLTKDKSYPVIRNSIYGYLIKDDFDNELYVYEKITTNEVPIDSININMCFYTNKELREKKLKRILWK